MVSFNKYVDETIARTKTVCILIKCIQVLLKYARADLPKGISLRCQQILAEHHHATHDRKGENTTEWNNREFI